MITNIISYAAHDVQKYLLVYVISFNFSALSRTFMMVIGY